jgi:type II secretory pathway pseudopilin PulG
VVRRQAGFTYLTALFVVALLLGGLALTGEMWETAAKREKEAELLFIGQQYRRAIGLYYDATPGSVKRYPRSLEELVKDPRHARTERYLRRFYPDPITGRNEWGFVKAPDGGIQGVHSLSQKTPVKRAGFLAGDAGFERAQKYADWLFVHTPR